MLLEVINSNIYGANQFCVPEHLFINSTFYENKEESFKGTSDSNRPITEELQTHNLGCLLLLNTDGKLRQKVMLWYLWFR